ncbi:MAG: ATP-binding cassette, subfamily bacterial, partial [Actinomycetota bacterium]|nr:ATP-binding cassette, subfamily bacterial [Actinomycetota bacterium]
MRDFLVSTRHFLDYTMGRNRRIATVAVFLVTLGYVASAGLAWALKLLADGMARRDQAASLLALALVIALLLASRAESFFADYVAVHQYRNAAHDLANHLLALDLTLPRVSHLEDPEYLDRYELLQGDVENLVKILWTWVRILAAGIQTALSSALLLGVHPVLALLPMAAAPVVAADARAARARDRGRLQGAADDRLEDALHRLAASPGPAKELKVSSAEQAIDTLASSAWECSTSKRVRAAARGSLLTFAAWTVFGAAQVMAAGWVGLRVIDGRARLGDILLVITLGLQARSQFGTFVWNAARGASTRLAFRRYRD